ncbi:MAG: Nif3-like dinuclear metal center hexameric protein [Clostridia bacterium]|nr:Nif3-like dinuclear metal center hexameric protein [Clostridia bacterium]
MNVGELYRKLEQKIPRELSCEWDNDGLMCCPDTAREVRRVLVALDVTEAITERAIEGGYDLIVSHHPLVFRPLRAINPSIPVAKKVIHLLCSGISVMSFHTRLDAVVGGVNDTLAAALGVCNPTPFGNGEKTIGRIGELETEMTLDAFAERVKAVTGAPFVTVSDAGISVRRVAILGGSGSDDVGAAQAAGADTYLSGELAHHHLTDAPEHGINLIAAGHFHTEHPVCERVRELLLEIDPQITVDVANSNRVRVI